MRGQMSAARAFTINQFRNKKGASKEKAAYFHVQVEFVKERYEIASRANKTRGSLCGR